MGCCANIFRRELTCHGGPQTTSKPSPTPSTTVPAKPSTGRPPPKSLKDSYTHYNNPVLHRPVEPAQYTSIAFSKELREAGITGSIGTVGDALDNALMESAIGVYKTELIDRDQSWSNRAEVEREDRGLCALVHHRPAALVDRLLPADRVRDSLR